MSQSETMMLIILGFAIATFLALIVGRLAWKLALRIGARRVQRNVPTTVVDLQNDRDKLRAEQAILSRKIEVRLEEMKLRMAEQAAEVTRNRNRVELLMQQISDQDGVIAARDAEIARLSSIVASLERDLANTRVHSEDLQQALTAKDVEVAGLQEKFLSKLDEAHIPPTPTLEEANSKLATRIRSLTAVPGSVPPPQVEPAASTPAIERGQIFVKPAGTQKAEAKAKARPAKKAPRVEKQLAKPEEPAVTAEAVVSQEIPALAVASAGGGAAAQPVAAAPADGGEKTGVTNVISLAQRIKALQREIAS